jgi:DNA repair protein RecO (recombination protein O)
MQQVDHTPAFVLHSTPYRNSSLIVTAFTATQGKVKWVANSARGPKSRYRGMLQPFLPLLCTWSGRHELKKLNQAESHGRMYCLNGSALACGFYLNELLNRLLAIEDPHPALYTHYNSALAALSAPQEKEEQAWTLRCFEKHLLKAIGYGLSFTQTHPTVSAIEASLIYHYRPGVGFIPASDLSAGLLQITGQTLLDLAAESITHPNTLKESKQLLTLALSQQLGDKPIQSRQLLI